MHRVIFRVLAVWCGLLSASAASAQDVAALTTFERPVPYMRMYGLAQPPYGFIRFCENTPDECNPALQEDSRFYASPERLSELDDVNRRVNRAIEPRTDLEIYGVNEYWTLPSKYGDCEDYALLKRHDLMRMGWPSSALLMTVVRDEKGEGHAVLTARTAQGDFVLDNKIDDVRLWSRTPYEFVMRQSYINPRVWVSLDPSQGTSPASIAGVDH
jgi:predicted transglutaminase-like cysteine proteinase